MDAARELRRAVPRMAVVPCPDPAVGAPPREDHASSHAALELAEVLSDAVDTGVNWDDSKTFVFKGIKPPPPDRSRGRSPERSAAGSPAETAAETADLPAPSGTDHLRAVDPPLRRKLQPHFAELIAQLEALPAGSPETDVLRPFETCIENVNRYGEDIQTADREALLAAIYDIGARSGLDRESRFAERWRGDW